MFAILIPVTLMALNFALLWAERKATKLARLDSPKPRTCSVSSPPSIRRICSVGRYRDSVRPC
jgi:hypothetical protein